MFDLRRTTSDLQFRHLTDADLDSLASILPYDAEQDPSATSYSNLDREQNRGVSCIRITGEHGVAPGAPRHGR